MKRKLKEEFEQLFEKPQEKNRITVVPDTIKVCPNYFDNMFDTGSPGCILLFQTGIFFHGNLRQNTIDSLKDLRDLADMWIDFLEG